MAAQVANPSQPLWYAAPSPTYPPERMSVLPSPTWQAAQRMSGQQQQQRMSIAQQQQQHLEKYHQRASVAPSRPGSQRIQSTMMMPPQAGQRMSGMAQQQQQQQQQQRASGLQGAWGGEYQVGPGFQEEQPQQQQEEEEGEKQESSGASTPETGGSSGSSSTGASGVDNMPAAKGNRKALRKLSRLVKRRGNDIVIITVYDTNGKVVCSLSGAQAGQEHTYMPSSDEGTYLFLALERGFKSEGSEFEFGWTTWLSGRQEVVDDKQTLLGNESTQEFKHHRFYGVLSPTGRYVVAAVLKEGPGGQLDAKLLRKIRNAADNFEVYEAWSGSSRLMAKLACAA